MATVALNRPAAMRPESAWGLAILWRPAALCVFAVWLLVVGMHHEPWFDEAQAWLLARDNDLWPLLAERVRYEGSPGLWHLILWLAIRAGLPFSHLYLISAGFALAGAVVVLWRAPFPALLRLAILASYFFGYQFSVVARSYCVDLLLVPLAATFFAARVERPLRYALVVGLIANVNSHGFIAAGILGLELTWRLWRAKRLPRARSLVAVALAGGLGLFALWSVWQPADNNFLLPGFRPNALVSFLLYVSNAFIDRIAVWSSSPAMVIDVLAGFGVSLLLQRPIIALFMTGRNRLLALVLLGALIAFSTVVYASPWHSGLLFLFWLFLLWIHWNVPAPAALRRDVAISLAIICLFQGGETIRSGVWDVGHAYSSGAPAARAVAAYRARHPTARIAAFGYKTFEVQPWLGQNVFANYHDGAGSPSYVVWSRREPWSSRVNASLWQHLLKTRPDLIVASPNDRGREHNLLPQACRAGYGIRHTFPATMVWRGSALEDETLVLFERGSAKGCHRA